MALICIRPLLLNEIIKSSKKNINVLLGPTCRCLPLSVNYSQHEIDHSNKLSKAMEAYIEKSKKYDEFLKGQIKEYELGKQFLAAMMGKVEEKMTQKEIDKAIEYLFPSSLFNTHARPKLRPPDKVFEKQKPVQFDFSGRPFHFLFYTTKPNYSQMLHDAAKKLKELDFHEQKMQKAGFGKPEKIMRTEGELWVSQIELEKRLLEKILPLEYDNFIELFTRLADHPYSFMAEDFIKEYRQKLNHESKQIAAPTVIVEDGLRHVVVESKRKTALATVKVSHPGSGKIRINNVGLDYFLSILQRQQVSF